MMMDESDTDTDDDDLSTLMVEHLGGTAGTFVVRRSDTEDQIVRKLRRLRYENLPTEIDFYFIFPWTERISHEMILTFQHFKDVGRQWNEAKFFDFVPGTTYHAHSVLQSPVLSQVFQKFSFENHEPGITRPMERLVATSLAFVMITGQDVRMYDFEIGNDAMACLSESLVTLAGSVAAQELQMEDLRFSFDEESSERRSAEQCLADGLAKNKTLVSFGYCGCASSDSNNALIIRSLTGHPTLKTLQLSPIDFGEETISAICGLLASPTSGKLSELEIWGNLRVREEGAAEFDFERFIEQLPTNSTVQSLTFADFQSTIDEDSANQLLRRLWKLPNLKYLNLQVNSIRDFSRLASNVTMTTPRSCLRVLYIEDDFFEFVAGPMSDEHDSTVRAIFHLLEVFPELSYLGEEIDKVIEQGKLPISLRERMDLNRYSGMLLRGASIPLSVWAVVLARVYMEDTKKPFRFSQDITPPPRKANVVYHMLHGPVFAGRGPLDR